MMYRSLIGTITRTYDNFIVKAYVIIRFKIINPSILDTMLNYFRPERDLLVLGCGFGLFDLLVGMKWPKKKITGIDLNEKRIQTAKKSAKQLGLVNNSFLVQDLSIPSRRLEQCDEILLLDVLHHIHIDQHEDLLRECHECLRPGGLLVMKEIHRGNAFKTSFSWLLDMLMTNWKPVFYREAEDLKNLLKDVGFEQVLTVHIDDLLPYPHIQYVCMKSE